MRHLRLDYNRIQDPEGKIGEDEPVFLIRGQDVCAPAAIHAYADFAELAGADSAVCEATRRFAGYVKRWQQGELEYEPSGKVPDVPGGIAGLDPNLY